MKCEICQCELPDGASFCPECGSMQEQRFEKQFEESIKKDNTVYSNNPYLQSSPYESNTYNNNNPYGGNYYSDLNGRQGVPPIAIEEGLSRREFYQLYQPDNLKKYSDILMGFLFVSIVASLCMIGFMRMYEYTLDLIFVSVIFIGYYLTRNKGFIYTLLGEQMLFSFLALFRGKGSGGALIVIIGFKLVKEIKNFDIYYKEYLQTGHVSSLNDSFRRTSPAKTSRLLIIVFGSISLFFIVLFYILSGWYFSVLNSIG